MIESLTININKYRMNKKQTQEYYKQLGKMDKAKTMHLSEVINILTNGSVRTSKAKSFLNYVSSNQFGEYSDIYEYIENNDWKHLSFAQIYEILKYLKEYLKQERDRNRAITESSQKELHQMASSFDEKQLQSNTIIEITQSLKEKHEGQLIEQQVQDEPVQNEEYETRWRTVKFKLVKKLLIVFDYLRKSMHIEGESFEKNQQMAEHMDLTMFMRYVKMFKLGSTFKPYLIIRAFKANAVNSIWLDFDLFIQTNFTIIVLNQNLPPKEKYDKLKGLNTLISSNKMKQILNVRGKPALATIVEGHTGTYKQDILDYLQQKLQKRRLKQQKRWRPKRLKTEDYRGSRGNSTEQRDYPNSSSMLKSKSYKKVLSRVKSEHSPSVYQQLKLPSLRIKQAKNQSIVESLKHLDLSSERLKLKHMINIEENEEYMDAYLKEEARSKEKGKRRIKKLHELPAMRF